MSFANQALFSLPSLAYLISLFTWLRQLGLSVRCEWAWREKASLPHSSLFVGTVFQFLATELDDCRGSVGVERDFQVTEIPKS